MKEGIFRARWLDSRVRGEDVQKSERMLGYFLGPCLAALMHSAVSGTYLIQFYTDVLGLAGMVLTMMPLISKLLSSLIGILIGRMIDRTRTRQGRARPWLLLSGVLLPVSGMLLYAVPRASYGVQIAWVVVSYNLFTSLAMSVYSLSHSMMVPLSTRNSAQRDGLAMLTSTAVSMIPGTLVTVVMPLLIQRIGVGAQARGLWLTVMGLLSIVALPGILMEYYFTLERVSASAEDAEKKVPFARQLSVCLHDKYWLLCTAFMAVYTLFSSLSGSSMLYYCNWVIGNSVEDGAVKQVLVNVIGQAPLGLGVFALWPLVRRFGKRKVTAAGFALAGLGSAVVMLGGENMPAVLGGMFVRAIGLLPTYLMAAHQAEAMDHVEQRNGFRADGLSASMNGVVQAALSGLSQTLVLWGIGTLGYIAPESAAQVIAQPEGVRVFLNGCFSGASVIGCAVCAVLMMLCDAEAKMKRNGKVCVRR